MTEEKFCAQFVNGRDRLFSSVALSCMGYRSAQELAKLLPELVKDDGENLGVGVYQELIPVLVMIMQEQRDEIIDLNDASQDMRSDIDQ